MDEIKKSLRNISETIKSDSSINDNSRAKEIVEKIDPIVEVDSKSLILDERDSIVSILEGALEDFEAKHPKLYGDVKIIINSLNEIGI